MARHHRILPVIGTIAACTALSACGGSNAKSNPGLNQAPPVSSAVSTSPATSAAAPSTASSTTSSAAATSPSSAASSATTSMVDYAPSPDPADPTAAAVLKAYRAFSDVKVTMYNGMTFSKQLAYVATGKAVEVLTDGVSRLRQDGINYVGRPKSSPRVTSVAGDTATVSDCFGSPEWRPVYAIGPAKGKSAVAPGSTVTAHPVAVTLKRFQGVWFVADAVTDPKPC